MISTSDLWVSYGDFVAIRGMNLEIERGLVYGLIGPNGAGKTSLIRVLATLLEPAYGDVRIGGIDPLLDPDGARRLLGFMPDTPPLYEDLLVHEFLAAFAAGYEIPAKDRAKRIGECLALTDLTGKAETLVAGLSRGMKQRLALAKTLLHNPEILLLDEPASGLDPLARIELRGVIRQLGQMGKTILISSHILPELADFCNAIGIMEAGRLVVSGRLEDILLRMDAPDVIEIRCEAPDPRLEPLLREITGVRRVTVEGASARVEWKAVDGQAADLLARLVQGGIRVQDFHERRQTIEDIFMKVGAHQVA